MILDNKHIVGFKRKFSCDICENGHIVLCKKKFVNLSIKIW